MNYIIVIKLPVVYSCTVLSQPLVCWLQSSHIPAVPGLEGLEEKLPQRIGLVIFPCYTVEEYDLVLDFQLPVTRAS